MTTSLIGETAVLTGRSLRHILRSPDTIITTVLMPIAIMLMFVDVFGGAVDLGGRADNDSYVNYLLPGILLITVASSIAYTAFRLFTDMSEGIVERFRSMPIARSSVLWAHALTSVFASLASLMVVVAAALIMGFRSSAGVLEWAAITGMLTLFTPTLTWIAVVAGFSSSQRPRTAIGLSADDTRHGRINLIISDFQRSTTHRNKAVRP